VSSEEKLLLARKDVINSNVTNGEMEVQALMG